MLTASDAATNLTIWVKYAITNPVDMTIPLTA